MLLANRCLRFADPSSILASMRTFPGGFAGDERPEDSERDQKKPAIPRPEAPRLSRDEPPQITMSQTPVSSDAPVVETRVPSSHDGTGDEQTVQAALLASTRAEATLSALYRAIQQVTAGVSGAREANDQLSSELQRVREMLGASNEQRLSLRNQVALLEQQLYEFREEAMREREFLLAEQDKFIGGLLEEHDQVVDRLVREREEALARVKSDSLPPVRRSTHPGLGAADATPTPGRLSDPGPDPEKTVERLVAERERAREVLRRLQNQRDEAQQSLVKMTSERDRILAELSRLAPARVAPKPAISIQDVRRTQPAVPMAVQRVTDPAPAEDGNSLGLPIDDRVTAPPEEAAVEAALVASRPSTVPGRSAASQEAPTDPPRRPAPVTPLAPEKRPPLKRKPDPTSRPLGGYSMSGEDLGAEQIENAPSSSARPPRR